MKGPKRHFVHIFLFFFWPLARPKIAQKKAVIQSAASAASTRGDCASSRLDQGLDVWRVQKAFWSGEQRSSVTIWLYTVNA